MFLFETFLHVVAFSTAIFSEYFLQKKLKKGYFVPVAGIFGSIICFVIIFLMFSIDGSGQGVIAIAIDFSFKSFIFSFIAAYAGWKKNSASPNEPVPSAFENLNVRKNRKR